MRNEEFQKIKKHIEAFCGSEKDAVESLEHAKKSFRMENDFVAAKKMVECGEFEVYYEGVEKFLKELYGEEYREDIYKTKKGDFRTKNGEVYVWTIYKNKIALALAKMGREVER